MKLGGGWNNTKHTTINGRLGELRWVYEQNNAISEDGESPENQQIAFKAIDGFKGRFYQVLFPSACNGRWNFTDPEELSSLAQDFIFMANTMKAQ